MIDLLMRSILPAGLGLLPGMDSKEARAMLVAIGLQESQFLARRQMNFGPARGFWQFEKNAVRGVARHAVTKAPLEAALRFLRYEDLIGQTNNMHYAIEDNDVLAVVFARLLLRTVPGRLPAADEPEFAYAQYLEGWRPGEPRPRTWRAYYAEAWERVTLQEAGR